MAKTNYGDFHYFNYIALNPSYGFATYKDPVTGSARGYVIGLDKNGQPIYKYWHFNYDSQKIKRVGKEERDLNKQLAYDFLREAPACMGSQNGEYFGEGKQTGYFYKEINTAKDAKEAVDSRKNLIKAQAAALELKGQELDDVASYLGVFDVSADEKTHRVLDYSSNEPTKFLALLEDKTLKLRSFIRTAVSRGVLKEEGKAVYWELKQIGADEEDAVATLMKDDKLKKAIETNLSKVG